MVIEPKTSRTPSWKPGSEPRRKKLQLLSRTKLVPGDLVPTASEDEPGATPVTQMLEADAKKRIGEDAKEFFTVRRLDEANVYFSVLTEERRFRLVNKLVGSVLESKEADTRLVAEFFARPASQRECSPDVFEAGFIPMVELLDNIVIDAPKAFEYMAIMLKGAGLDRNHERLQRIVEKRWTVTNYLVSSRHKHSRAHLMVSNLHIAHFAFVGYLAVCALQMFLHSKYSVHCMAHPFFISYSKANSTA